MTTFVFQAKYTAAALAAVRKDGYASRIDQMHSLAASLGGTMQWVGFCDSSTADFISVMDLPEDAAFYVGSFCAASGAFQSATITATRTAAELDAIIAQPNSWRAPGAS